MRACEIQLKAQGTGDKLIPIAKPILEGIRAQESEVTKATGGQIAWPEILRKLDRLCPDYKN